MVSESECRNLALSFPNVVEEPHFEKTSFRISKKIFATYDKKNNLACLKLSLIDQSVFSSYDISVFYPVPNKWGSMGWTIVNLEKVRKTMLKDALSCAYNEVIPKGSKK